MRSRSAHDRLKGLSGSFNPAHCSFPLAFCPWIDDQNRFRLSCSEACLTHFTAAAGQVAGVVNLICRRLLRGDEWPDAVKTAFSTAPHRLGKIQEIQFRYEHDPILKSQKASAYALNTLHTSLYCVTHPDSFEDALKCANNIETYYCPTLVGILASARWLVSQSMLTNIQKDTLKKIREVAKCFTNE